MKSFHTIVVPHKDILEGRLTLDIFAADLWEVSRNRGPDDYLDLETFFSKTYMTQGLENLLGITEKRLKGKGGDAVIQVQTPFGGGKTHSLIAMYHKAKMWGANRVVIVGTAMSTDDTIWGLLEKQLTGKIKKCVGKVAPGKEILRELLTQNEPVLILMDEVLEYATKAAGVKVEKSTLAAQTLAFMQELTETVASLEKVSLVITLPSSILEHYDAGSEKLYQQLQKVAGRLEKIYTPVQENEITKIIRRRLFSSINEAAVSKTVAKFVEYLDKEGILPAGVQPSQYRDRFIDSYPFLPEVVDVLYQRWGSFPTFQRTRGVLRLLALIIYSLRKSNIPYISLADFDLAVSEIRQEFLKYIGAEFNGIVDVDITSPESGARKVDGQLGKAYQGLELGSRAATSIFLYSFSGGHAKGATQDEIKRSATTVENPSSVVSEATESLKTKLFYLQSSDDRLYFSNEPNLVRILFTKIENIKRAEVVEVEKQLLKDSISGGRFKVYIWEKNPANIADSEDMKLVILPGEGEDQIKFILEKKGQTPRVNRNTIFFLYPLESEKSGFVSLIQKKIAYENIEKDRTLQLSGEQKKEVKVEHKKIEAALMDHLRRYYRIVAVPNKDGFKTIDLGIPTYGESISLDIEIYDKLRSDGEIVERIAPLVIKEKYLLNKECVSTAQIYQSSLTTPGETRLVSNKVLEEGIMEGVRKGLFGLGEIEGGQPVVRYIKEQPTIALSGKEVIIAESICKKQEQEKGGGEEGAVPGKEEREVPGGKTPGEEGEGPQVETRKQIELQFKVPKGKVAGIMGVMNLLQAKFETLEIRVVARDGEISERDYEDKIKETFRQLEITFNE